MSWIVFLALEFKITVTASDGLPVKPVPACRSRERPDSREVVRNPHNQTLNVAVQWGLTGVAVLYGMWLAHFLMFRGSGLASWIGVLVVIQNLVSSLFNSHLFDFHEGWMYVLGVGIAGGMSVRERQQMQTTMIAALAQPSSELGKRTRSASSF